MSREYIARDPRTGLPIEVGTKIRKEKKVKTETGPWMILTEQEILQLFEGEVESVVKRWKNENHTLTLAHAVRALGKFQSHRVRVSYPLLMQSFESDDPEVRIAALQVLPEVAVLKSDELFDWLSVLMDDPVREVRMAASTCLTLTSPIFPSGVESILANELRSPIRTRSDAAWKGLNGLCETWPEVVVDHVDSLLLEEDPQLRTKATMLLKKIVSRGDSAVWDLISWSLNDSAVEVRRAASKTLPSLARKESRIATLFAERAIIDSDSKVRLNAIKAIQTLDSDHGRARELVIKGTLSKDVKVRSACIELLPRLFGEDVLRTMASDLLKNETDPKLITSLTEMTFDASLDGTEAQKNAQLAPSAPVPAIDREIAEAQGQRVGLEPERPTKVGEVPSPTDAKPVTNEATPTAAETPTAPLYKAVSQDEMMGYDDDFEDDSPDDDEDYF
jgi:hypothetical protein